MRMNTVTFYAQIGLLAAGAVIPTAATWAQTPSSPDAQIVTPASKVQPAAPETRQSTPGGETAVKPTEGGNAGLWERANLLGDPGGFRSRLTERGISFGLSEASEVFGNATGGTKRGVIYEGLTEFSMGLDTQKLFGWEGGTFNVSGYQIHGRGLSQNNLNNNLNTVSSLEAPRGTLLFELWYEQVFLDKKLAVRVGQLGADQEFMISQYGNLFLNHTFGWSTYPSVDLPSGGPAYPLATPGVRVKYAPRDDLALLLGVFNGDPAGPGRGIAQDRDPSGTAFRTQDGVFAIVEAQYATNQDEKAEGLPGTYKIGAWYNSQNFADQRRNATGGSLADPTGTAALGRNRRGNWSGYAVMDQLLVREANTKDQGLGIFARVMGGPGDRNLINFYVDGGVTYKGVFPGRDSDVAGIALGVARISDTAAQLDADTRYSTGGTYPIRRHETVVELTYQAQIAPWWQVQPSAQYVFNLNGGVPNPKNPTKRLGDAAVLGLRTNVTF